MHVTADVDIRTKLAFDNEGTLSTYPVVFWPDIVNFDIVIQELILPDYQM